MTFYVQLLKFLTVCSCCTPHLTACSLFMISIGFATNSYSPDLIEVFDGFSNSLQQMLNPQILLYSNLNIKLKRTNFFSWFYLLLKKFNSFALNLYLHFIINVDFVDFL